MRTSFTRIVLGLLLGFTTYLAWLGVFGLYPAIFGGVIVAALIIFIERLGF